MARANVGTGGIETESRVPPAASGAAESDMGAAASQAAERARHETRQLMGQAKDRAKSALADQKGVVAEQIGSVADALRMTAHNLSDQNKASTARYADWAADGLERLSMSFRDRDIDSLVSQATDFARRRPAAFLGGAVVAGLLLSRFLKSSFESGEMESGRAAGSSELEEGYGEGVGDEVIDRPMTAGAIIVEEGPVETGPGAPGAGGSNAG